MRKLISTLGLFLLALITLAQDPQFSQFYAAPLYLNPAFTGTTKKTRVNSIYRNQWVRLPGSFATFSFSADHNLPDFNSGVGLIVTTDRQGVANYKLTDLGLLYSYGLNINNKWAVRSGLQFGIARRSLDVGELVFGNQLDEDFGFTGASSGELAGEAARTYFDFTGGLLAYSKTLWFGTSIAHINRPNQSFLFNGQSIVPIRATIHGGAKIKILRGKYTNNEKEYTFSPAFNYRAQGAFDQLDLGAYINYHPIVLGLWYRGIPVFKQNDSGFINHDAIAVLIGFHKDNLTLGYSYDLTVSQLSTNTGGSHEISVGYEFIYGKKKKKKYEKFIPCPKF